MNSLARQLNEVLERESPDVLAMLSKLGKDFYFPKGILTQSAEAKQKATRYNATIGIAKENGTAMHLPSVMRHFAGLSPDEVLPYAPSPGLPALRTRWLEHIRATNPSLAGKEVSLPVVTSGVTHGLSLTADLFAEAGDTVLLPDKVWGNYLMVFGVRRNARIARYRFFSENGGLDTRGFRETLDAESKSGKLLVMLNFPNNPTGYSPTEKEADELCEALVDVAQKGCRVVAICDDAYSGLIYEPGVIRESIFARLAGKHPRLLAVKLDGATKEDYVWGMRVAFVTFAASGGSAVYDALEKKAGGCIRGTVSNASNPSQAILLKSMNDPDHAAEKKQKFEVLQSRAKCVKKALDQSRYDEMWTPYPFNSGYFMCLRLNTLNAETFRLGLLDRCGIGVIATAPTDIRVAFSCIEEKEIPDLFDRMFECAREMTMNPAGNADVSPEAFEE